MEEKFSSPHRSKDHNGVTKPHSSTSNSSTKISIPNDIHDSSVPSSMRHRNPIFRLISPQKSHNIKKKPQKSTKFYIHKKSKKVNSSLLSESEIQSSPGASEKNSLKTELDESFGSDAHNSRKGGTANMDVSIAESDDESDDFEDDILNFRKKMQNTQDRYGDKDVELSKVFREFNNGKDFEEELEDIGVNVKISDHDLSLLENEKGDRKLLDKFSENKRNLKKAALRKYSGKLYTVPRGKKELLERIRKHFYIVPKILNGVISSEFYGLARDCRNCSNNDVMSRDDFMKVDLQQFIGGYYGLNRQTYISLEVKGQFERELVKAASRNMTIKFWSLDSFALYVLANEVICRLVMEDFQCEQDKAYDIMRESADFGKYVTDDEEFIDDLGQSNFQGDDTNDNDDNNEDARHNETASNGSEIKSNVPVIPKDTSDPSLKEKTSKNASFQPALSRQRPSRTTESINNDGNGENTASDDSEDELESLLKFARK